MTYKVIDGTNVKVIGNDGTLSGEVVLGKTVTYSETKYTITQIGYQAFANLPKLTKLVIQGEIESIEDGYLEGNQQNLEIKMYTVNPPQYADPYSGFYKAYWTLRIPKEAYDVYVARGWTGELQIAYLDADDVIEDEVTEKTTINGLVFGIVDSYAVLLGCEETPTSIEIPSSITYNEVDYAVTKISSDAFNGNTTLTSVTIPSSVTSIGSGAFKGCTALETISVNATVPPTAASAFDNFDATVYVPAGCTEAYQGADGWSSFTKICEPGGGVTFTTESGLTFVTTTTEEVKLIANSDKPYSGAIVVPATVEHDGTTYKVTSISADAFNGTTLTSIEIPGSVERVTDNLFKDNTTLKTAVLKSGVKVIGVSAFYGCTALETITIPETVTAICSSALNNCSALTSLTIPGGVKYWERDACSGCTSLKELILRDSEYTFNVGAFWDNPDEMFGGTYIEELDRYFFSGGGGILFEDCPLETIYLGRNISNETMGGSYTVALFGSKAITTVTIAGNTTTIHNNSFYGCSNITSLTLGDKLTSIGNAAFATCTGLTGKLVIPNSVTTINEEAFWGAGWTSVTIPSSVTTIGKNAFNGASLNDLIIEDSENELTMSKSGLDNAKNIYIGRTLNNTTPFNSGVVEIVEFGDKVTAIPAELFNGCANLSGVLELGENITSIGENAFASANYSMCCINAVTPPTGASGMFNSDALVAVIVPAESQSAYAAAEYWKDYTILVEKEVEVTVTTPGNLAVDVLDLDVSPKNVTKLIVHGEINSDDFNQMRGTTFSACRSIDLSDADCETIPEGALQDKKVLMNIVLPNNCVEIKNCAFSGCNSLKSELTLPSGLTTIEYEAFNGTNLSGELVLPAKLESVGYSAFAGNSNLEKITVEEGSKLATMEYGVFSDCTGLKEVDLSAAPMTTLKHQTFANCYNLSTIVLPSKLEELSESDGWFGVFENCTSIETIEFPETLKRINGRAFSGCSKLD